MKGLPIILIAILLSSCERAEEAKAEIDSGSLEALEALNLPEPELDDMVLQITEGYEYLRPFLQEEIPPLIFEELFRDIRLAFEDRQKKVGPDEHNWLYEATIERRGVGMLSMYGDQAPATVRIDQHHTHYPRAHIARDVVIGKPEIWDRVVLGGVEYSRLYNADATIRINMEGVKEVSVDFYIMIFPYKKPGYYQGLRNPTESMLYQLRGYFLSDVHDQFKGRSKSWFASYKAMDSISASRAGTKSANSTAYKTPKLLSQVKYCDAEFILSEQAKRELLSAMELVVISQTREPGESVFSKLLKERPYKLAKPSK